MQFSWQTDVSPCRLFLSVLAYRLRFILSYVWLFWIFLLFQWFTKIFQLSHMRKCVSVWIRMRVCVRMYIHSYVFACLCLCVFMYVPVNVRACLRVYVHKRLRADVFVCLYVYVFMCTRVLQNYFCSLYLPNFTAFSLRNTPKICHSFISFLSLPKGFPLADSSER